ncbi:HupE/UreJ family protein [Vibrio hannami]|uniref:HupE/UreJ family protein n=1 Tax=Vibrio hannami TaxID=2717094 RepID=UPI00240F1B5A|nr:HupE/UreJ family protein [Vibrio hannami]MDG3086403.1 HupE/UreJ family protein [Vibrio hannami]
MKNKTPLLLLALISSPALAHSDASGSGFMSGVTHPIFGLDHLLAMLSIGILSAQLGGRSIWQLPTTFVLVMVIGGVLGMLQVPMLPIELGIALSVLVLGAGIALDRNLSSRLAIAFAALFAVFHGYAHGLEMPSMASPASYIAGFIIGTTAIHIIGVFIGVFSTQCNTRRKALRGLGASIMFSGVYFLAGA